MHETRIAVHDLSPGCLVLFIAGTLIAVAAPTLWFARDAISIPAALGLTAVTFGALALIYRRQMRRTHAPVYFLFIDSESVGWGRTGREGSVQLCDVERMRFYDGDVGVTFEFRHGGRTRLDSATAIITYSALEELHAAAAQYYSGEIWWGDDRTHHAGRPMPTEEQGRTKRPP